MAALDLAIQTPPEHTSFSRLRDLWQAADELGFVAAYTFDHLVPLNPGERPGAAASNDRRGPQLEGWTALAALAAGTRRLHVGTLVTGVTYRHPSMLAKMAVTLDHVTDGRAILGIGAAWHADEHRMFGLDFPPVGERMGRLDEALHVFRALCAAQPGASVSYDGTYYRLDAAAFEPPPVRSGGIPILVGGTGARLKRIAARHASMFNSFAAPWEWGALNGELDNLMARASRSATDMQRTAFVFSELSAEPARQQAMVEQFQGTRGGTEDEVRRRILVGDPASMVEVLRSYADAGVHTAIINIRPHNTVEHLELLAREVMPGLG